MIISLVGYMGSGKSHISKILSKSLGYELIDLDSEITRKNQRSVAQIFEKKGELYFRKAEREVLEETLARKTNCVLSVGGGTPAYFNNMEVINSNTVSFYLRAPVSLLTERLLRNKQKRPLIAGIADENLSEFVAKHLFERSAYYNMARFTIDTNAKTPENICAEIIEKASECGNF